MTRTPEFRSQKELIHSLKAKGLSISPRVEAAVLQVDRRVYGPDASPLPLIDSPQSIGCHATISAMHMHLMCLELLQNHLRDQARGLDIGSGSGYLTAVMGLLLQPNGRVIGIEHITELLELSRRHIEADQPQLLKTGLVTLVNADGRSGYPESAPYDFIHVGAAASSIPPALLDQLAIGGRMIIPIGPPQSGQSLIQIDKLDSGFCQETHITWVSYVPLCSKSEQLNDSRRDS